MAAECPDCRLLHVSAEARLVEVVHEDGTPCAPGEIGRVLVTSYSNFAMPLLRYDVGDYAEVGPLQAPCGRPFPSLVRIMGRASETFIRRDGTRFFPTLMARKLEEVMPLKQVQFAQTDYEMVEIRYVPGLGSAPIDDDAVQRYIKSRIGEEFSAKLVPMSEIPRAPSGKFFYHLCEVPAAQSAPQPAAGSAASSR
jgi:phenylacetate-CoA ligase